MKNFLFLFFASFLLQTCSQKGENSANATDSSSNGAVKKEVVPPVTEKTPPQNPVPANKPEKGLVYDKVGLGAEGYDSPLKFSKVVFNIGNVSLGGSLSLDIPAKNTSDKTIYIETIRVSCGCMQATYPKGGIYPGEEFFIRGTFDSRGLGLAQYEKLFSVKVRDVQIPQAIQIQVMVTK
jgi:Protein of unknown function (DUF1573)